MSESPNQIEKSAKWNQPETSSGKWTDWIGRTWCLAFLGAIFYWLSLPPMKLPWAGFLAATCWVALIAKESPLTRRDYWCIWFAGALMWLALLQGIRLAFWPLYAGWLALSLYLAAYLPMFIAMARSLNRTYRVPLALSAATTWVGCELIRAYFVTGFAACMLAHSQVPWPWMLPVASYFGCYGISFVVMFAGAVLYQWLAWAWLDWAWNRRGATEAAHYRGLLISNIACSMIVLGIFCISFWSLRMRDEWLASQDSMKPLGTILLIQDDMPTQFDGPPEDAVLGWNRYERQTATAAKINESKKIDLVVWPESTFIAGPSVDFLYKPCPDMIERDGFKAEFGLSKEDFSEYLRICKSAMEYKVLRIGAIFKPDPPKLLLGVDVLKARPEKTSRFNAALWVDPTQVDGIQYYAKQHLVLFGETFPFISGLLSMVGLGVGGLDAGDRPLACKLPSGATISTSICFEDVLPHLTQSQVRQLSAEGNTPDILVNITNDGWFRGSSILDHHLNNAILTAVENRMPMLVAANLGISAWIDGDGRVVRSLPRLEGGSILAEPIADGRWGLWKLIGDWPARTLAIASCMPFLVGLAKRIFMKRPLPN